MKKRVIWKVFLLTVLTLGIYRLYWFVKTRKEMMRTNREVKIMTPWFMLLPIGIAIAAIAALIIGFVQAESKLPAYCNGTNTQSSSSRTVYVDPVCEAEPPVWTFVFFYLGVLSAGPLFAIWLWSYAKGVEKVTGGNTNFAISMIVLLLVPDGIDILIIQDAFNKLADSTIQNGDTPPHAPLPAAT